MSRECFLPAYFNLCHFNKLIYSSTQWTILTAHVWGKKEQAVMGRTAL